MHTVAEHNADALPDFIKEAKKQGYTFGTLDDLVFDHLVDDYLWGKLLNIICGTHFKMGSFYNACLCR